jgi:hypothetical protein
MLEAAAIVMLTAWLLGLLSSYTMSGMIHVLPVLALLLITVKLFFLRRDRHSVRRHQ